MSVIPRAYSWQNHRALRHYLHRLRVGIWHWSPAVIHSQLIDVHLAGFAVNIDGNRREAHCEGIIGLSGNYKCGCRPCGRGFGFRT